MMMVTKKVFEEILTKNAKSIDYEDQICREEERIIAGNAKNKKFDIIAFVLYY